MPNPRLQQSGFPGTYRPCFAPGGRFFCFRGAKRGVFVPGILRFEPVVTDQRLVESGPDVARTAPADGGAALKADIDIVETARLDGGGPCDGVVKQISVSKGDVVATGDMLLVI